MDIDLDDLLSNDAANTAKAGIKFQPKGKPKSKPKPKPNAQPESKSTPTPSTQVADVAATTKERTGDDANQIIRNILDSLQSSSEKPQEDNTESFVTLNSPNDFLPEATTKVNLPPPSETQTIDVSMEENLETVPTEPELISNVDASTNLESIAELDPLTGEGAAILNDNGNVQMGNISQGSKFQEVWEPLDILTQSIKGSGPRAGKFKPKPKPKPKALSRKMELISNNPDQVVGPIQNGENLCSVPSQPNFMKHGPAPSFTPDEIPTETISDYHVNEEANKLLQLVDEAEKEGIDGNNNDEDYLPENESLIDKTDGKSKTKSKKSLNKNKKPGRKRKKDTEVPDEITEVPKKKFKHSTKQSKRPVNPELLNIPEDELELHMHSFPLRDLIRLREHKEKIEKKEAFLSRKDTADPSDLTHYNYHTHMKITPRMRWTKLDTELFYQALQQFGPNWSMVKECFPGRTDKQMKSKFKKEENLHRSRIDSTLNTRIKDHSYFEFVIERLKQARTEDSEKDDPYTSADEEDKVVATDNNEGGNVELQKEVKDMEPDVPDASRAESPAKSNDIEDDFWSQYKSDI